MDTDPSTGPYLSNGISKGAQGTATKFSTTLSKQNKQSLQSIHENHDSNHMTRDEEGWLHEDKDEKEQRAIDYLKELSDNEPPSTSNFEAGLRNFCLANFLDNKNKKQPKVETQKSARSALISMLPKHKELTEHSLVVGNTSKSPSMQQHLELLDSNKEKKLIKVETSSLVKPFKIKGIRPKETSQGPTEEMQKQKALEIAEMVDLGREKNRKEALMMESQFGAFKRIPLQIGTATFLKEKPRHSSQEEDTTGRVPNNLRTAQSFSKQIKSKLLHEQILNGRSLSVPKMDKLKDTSLMRNSMGFEEIGIPIVINGGLGLVSLNRKENRDEITIKRDVDKETGVTGLRRSSTNLNNTKEESSKENLQNIVKAALYTKVQPVVNSSEHFPGSQTERGISNVTVAQFWNYNNKGLSTERTKPKTTTKSGGIKENRARTESPERDPVKEARDKKRKEMKSRELKPFRDIHARTTSTFQSMRWIQAESHNVISGIQGKSFMVTQLFKDQQYTKGSLFTDDVEEPSSSRLGLKDTNCEQDFIQSSSHSPRPSISRSNSQPHLNVPNQKPASHSLLQRFKGFSKGLTSKVKNVGSLTARLTSHEDLLNGVSISKEYNESKMASLIQEELKPATRVQTSSKDKRYLQLRNKSRGNTSSMSRKDHTLLTTVSIDIRAKPLNMSLYNWAASFGAHLKKNSVS